MVRKVLVANRGEIAVRIIRTLEKMKIGSVSVFTEKEKNHLHVHLADEAVSLGEGSLSETYLNAGKMISIAKSNHCDAIHPGYGFLSENHEFAGLCKKEGLIFIGPDAESIRLMGKKKEAGKYVASLGIPVIPGIYHTGSNMHEMNDLGYPVIIKAAAGGGGKGMHIVYDKKSLRSGIEIAEREAESYFGDHHLIVEKYLPNARHIEVQVLGDHYGNFVHLYERECSVQRRYQKIIEESPAVGLNEELRNQLYDAALKICKAVNYKNAGTVEFLVGEDESFYFLEMNTRIQVEHGITEMVTGIDLVEEQIRICSGEKLRFRQEHIKQNGHAIEARMYAENPYRHFEPSAGRVSLVEFPASHDYRADTYLENNTRIFADYDPLIAKVMVHRKSRKDCIEALSDVLTHTIIHGIDVNIPLLINILKSETFLSASFYTGTLEKKISSFSDGNDTESLTDLVIAGLFLSLNDVDKSSGKTQVWREIGYWRPLMIFRILIDDIRINAEVKHLDKKLVIALVNGEKKEAERVHQSDNAVTLISGNKQVTVFFTKAETGTCLLSTNYRVHRFSRTDILRVSDKWNGNLEHNEDSDNITAPLPGRIIKLLCLEGQQVKKGQEMVLIESMKMENSVLAVTDCTVRKIHVKNGDTIEKNQVLVEVNPP